MEAGADREQTLAAEDEEVILLTQVVEEPPTEVVLQVGSGDLNFLNLDPETPAPAGTGEAADPLADLLASLKEFPTTGDSLAVPGPGPEAALTASGSTQAGLPLSEAEVAELVRQEARQAVERLARELVPRVAEQLVAQEIKAWKKRLSQEE
jgi:hypothetical protein